jgi:hypothetical protein
MLPGDSPGKNRNARCHLSLNRLVAMGRTLGNPMKFVLIIDVARILLAVAILVELLR